jgi:hypothetical protein
MNLLVEEEEQGAADEAAPGGIDERRRDEKDSSKSEDDDADDEEEEEELEDLPRDIAELLGSELFESEQALEEALVRAGVTDLPSVLVDKRPRLVVPSEQHNYFTEFYQIDFLDWAKGRWGFCSATRKIHLEHGRSRDPDLSYWGYPQCTRNEDGRLRPLQRSVPDVIIQFSFKKNKAHQQYEEDSFNDMMNSALEKDHGLFSTTRPTFGYLIQVRFSRNRRTLQGATRKGSTTTQDVEGLDIFRLTHGTTMADARDPNNNNNNNPHAIHWRCSPGGPECIIAITPGDLGITTGFWAWMCGDYRIKASVLYEKMKKVHQECKKQEKCLSA